MDDKESCCTGITTIRAHHHLRKSHEDDYPLSMPQCLLEIADMPVISSLSISSFSEMAKFAWTVPTKTNAARITRYTVDQYFWSRDSEESLLKLSSQTTSPYHRPSHGSISSNDVDSQNGSKSATTRTTSFRPVVSSVSSTLDRNGGMHRLLHHSVQLLPAMKTYYLFFVVPQGMFIDLDDPIHVPDGTIMNVISSSSSTTKNHSNDAKYSMHVTSSESNTPSYDVHLYAAKVCDIEQPAFVSGQHILVWEIRLTNDPVGTTMPSDGVVLNFSTKLHLRYPLPTTGIQDWIYLPEPLLFGIEAGSDEEEKHTSPSSNVEKWQLDINELVWVATGNDQHYYIVMWVTISSCVIGVVMMLRDISKVSLWDDV
jgi:hypothetical protein